ncbi:MAG: glutamine amidotransferase, partial [Planctomycetota bacterium]
VTARAHLPPDLFLYLFGGTSLYLELADRMLFAAPGAFRLLLATPWVFWLHHAGYGGLRGARADTALFARLALIGVFVIALADPRAVRKSDAMTVLYALDLSDSVGAGATDASLRYIARTVVGRAESDEAGLVVFGRNAAVELPPRLTFTAGGEEIAINSRIVRDGTDLAQALSLAAAMLPETNPGRIVLISDGAATEGNLLPALEMLEARKVPVDVLPIQYDFPHEVWLDRLDLPRFVREGETYEAAALLSSLAPGTGTLTLRENGAVIGEKTVEFEAGKNKYVLPLYLRGPGYYEYVATIDVPKGRDGWTENNVAINSLYLKGEGKVLVVTDPDGESADWERLADALRKSKRLVEILPSFRFPSDALSLMPYDCVAFVNVPADAFDAVQLAALRDAVRNLGVGFLMVGGKNSFGPGGYHRTPVEEALPVTMDVSQKKNLPKGALVIILHTCEFAEGNTWAKRITKQAIQVLDKRDEAGVLVYSYGTGGSGEQWLFPLTPVEEYERLAVLINQAEIGDMPAFGPTMEMGLKGLQASDAAAKHMIIISDGDPQPPSPALLRAFVDAGVSVSTVAVNPHGGVEQRIMQTIAGATGGRYYFPKDPKLLPSIFIKEAKTLRRNMIQNKTFVPALEMPSPVLKGIEAIPPLHGYVLTTPKPFSLTLLKDPSEGGEIDPVLVTWRFGLGKAAAFTSDLSPNWGKDWVHWASYQPFLEQLLTDISRVEQKTNLRVRAFASGNTGVILVEDHDPQGTFLDLEGRVRGPYGRTGSVSFRQVGPRMYQGRFPLWGKGQYQVLCVGAGEGRKETDLVGLIVPYSPEYLRFRAEPLVLKEIAQKTGGRLLAGDEDGKAIFLRDRPPLASSRSVLDWFLFCLAFLVPIDVGIRRVQLDWQVIRGWLRFTKRLESSATLSALLRRKDAVKSSLEAAAQKVPAAPSHLAEVKRAMPPGRRRGGKGAWPKTPPPGAKPPAGGTEPEKLPTTSRLLAGKRRWKKKDRE